MTWYLHTGDAVHSAENSLAAVATVDRWNGQTDGRTDRRPTVTYTCSAYDAGSKNTVHHTKTQNFRGIRKNTFNDTQLNNRT